MEPQVLRCEARRPGGGGLGLWRYSLAALILGAAMFDALLWVPAHRGDRPTREPSVSAEISRCRHARELEAAKRELEAPRSPSLWRLHYVGK